LGHEFIRVGQHEGFHPALLRPKDKGARHDGFARSDWRDEKR
jgi:hypothetical protein